MYAELKLLFGEDMQTSADGDLDLTLNEFLDTAGQHPSWKKAMDLHCKNSPLRKKKGGGGDASPRIKTPRSPRYRSPEPRRKGRPKA